MCNGFKNAREHYTVGRVSVDIYLLYNIYIIILRTVTRRNFGHYWLYTRLDFYSHKTHCVISNPYDCSDILYRVRPRHLFFASLYVYVHVVEKRPTYRLAVASSVRFPRPFVFLRGDFLQHNATCRNTRRRSDIPHPPV